MNSAPEPVAPEPVASPTLSTRTDPRSRSRGVFWLFLLLLAAGAGLRTWYASGELHINRFEDEKYSLRNVRKILNTGDFEPASAYYPSPVFNLPQVLALKASDGLAETFDLPWLSIRDRDGLNETAILITRLYQTLCGVLSLWLAFLVGRRLASPTAGLFAATILAFMPWMIHSSGYNKPDALLVMAVLLSLHAALRAMAPTEPWPTERRSSIRMVGLWMWAGLCIALAMSAKITGGFAAVPLTVGAVVAPGDRGLRLRRLGLLMVAGATSAIAFVLMNPYWRAYLFFLRGLQRDYAGRTEASRWEIPGKVAAMHLEGFFLGPVLGTLALLALIGCALLLVRRRAGVGHLPTPTHVAMLLAYPVVYAIAYAAQTSYFKPNNFLPTIPFSVLALSIWLDAALRAAEVRWPGRRRALRVGLAIAILGLAAPVGWRYVYFSRVPTTLDVVVAQLGGHLKPAAGQVVFMERWTPPPIPWDGTRPLHKGLSALVQSDDLGEMPEEDLQLAAAVVLVRPETGEAGRLTRGWPTSLRWSVNPIPLRYRGPSMEVVLRAAERDKTGLVTSWCGSNCVRATLPEKVVAGDVVSVFAMLPEDAEAPRLAVGGRDLPLHFASRQRDGVLFASPRLRLPPEASVVRIVAEEMKTHGSRSDDVQIELHRWFPSPNQQPPPQIGN
ncbi:MAG: glycosyltransferase family 39 protein [Thermoanaerobaculia bacterium]|nr:glycosyltransferase family 39 protein [Thermoanaerobaculia bacterium]